MNLYPNNISPETIKKAKLAKWLIIAGGVVVVAPMALLLLKGVIALAVAGLVGLGSIYLGPVIEMKLRNVRIKMVVAEAQTNPIETLLNQLITKREAASSFGEKITGFRAEIKNFQDKVGTFTKQYPEDAPRFAKQLETMQQLLSFREERYRNLNAELDNFAKAIDRAKAMWAMSQAAQQMNKMAGQDTGDVFEQIKTDAAVDSVMRSVNTAFSQMETALLDNPEVKRAQLAALDHTAPAVLTLDVPSAVQVPVQTQQRDVQ
jgi:hypothetical protein